MKSMLIVLATLLLATASAYAQDSENKRPGGEHRGPPPVALETCASAVQGDPCSFEGRQGDTLQGTCEAPDDKPLACRPEGHSMPDRPKKEQ